LSSEYVYSGDKDYLYFDFDNARNYLEFFLGGEIDSDMWGSTLTYGLDSNYFDDYEEYDDTWDEGYIIDSYDNENLKNIFKIVQIVDPHVYQELKLDSVILTGDSQNRGNYDKEKVSKVLGILGNLKESIIDEYRDATVRSQIKAANEEISKVDDDISKPLGFERDGRIYEYYKIPLSSVVLNYSRFGSPSDDLETIFKAAAFKLSNFNYESEWDLVRESFDRDEFDFYFQRDGGKTLEDYLEDLTENSENLQEYRRILKTLSDKYQFNRWYKLPGGKQEFYIDYVNNTNNLLRVLIRDSNSTYRQRAFSITFEDFNNLVNNASMFDLNI
jgi:hypothetical protein